MGASISLANILGSYAFGGGGAVGSGTRYLNIWNDSTGAVLASDNGDTWDVSISYGNVTPGGPPSGRTSAGLGYDATTDRLTLSHGFIQGRPSFPKVNNPGTRIESEVIIRFGSHVRVDNLILDFIGLNSGATTWETSMVGYLQPDGTPFSAEPVLQPYLSHTTVNGSPSLGWFIVDSKGTVNGVGGGTTTTGPDGTYNDLTATGSNNYLDYDDVGLAPGTEVGGFVLRYVVEDVRGTGNSASAMTASLVDFQVAGMTMIPESTSGLRVSGALLLILGIGLRVRGRIRNGMPEPASLDVFSGRSGECHPRTSCPTVTQHRSPDRSSYRSAQ